MPTGRFTPKRLKRETTKEVAPWVATQAQRKAVSALRFSRFETTCARVIGSGRGHMLVDGAGAGAGTGAWAIVAAAASRSVVARNRAAVNDLDAIAT